LTLTIEPWDNVFMGFNHSAVQGDGHMQIAGAYVRKSSVQKEMAAGLKSIEQQLDEVQRFAAAHGWKLDEQYVYSDDEISGEEWVKRPGYQRLRAALAKPPFKHMIVWERSRLGRDAIRQLMFISEMTENGIDVWTVNENKQLRANDIATMVGAWKDEQDNEDTRGRVNRALATRFEMGLVTGGSVYGYRNVRLEGVDKAVRREPDPEQAAIVVKIFELAAQGWGQTRIAKHLQSTGVKSPTRITEVGRIRRARKDTERAEAGLPPLPPIIEKWTGDGVREILRRELYRGNIIRGRMKRGKRGGTQIRTATPERVQTRHDESLRIVTEEQWKAAHDKMAEASAKFLRVHNRLIGRPENFRGKHMLSNVARCAVCGAPLHAVTRGSNLRLGYVCSANRTSGSCPNASSAPAAELHAAVVQQLRGTFTAESFDRYLADKAASPVEIDARHAQLAHLVDVVIPGLDTKLERLMDAIEGGTLTKEQAQKRATQIREEREVAEAQRDELQCWARNAVADREQAEELLHNWTSWSEAMEAEMQKGESALSRQVLAKALAGSPIYVMPGPERRTWFFLGLASYEGVLRGAVRPGAIATFVQDDQDPAPLVDRGAPPLAVRQWLTQAAAFQGGEPLPKALFVQQGKTKYDTVYAPPRRPDGTVDDEAIARLMVPAWARSQKLKPRPIAGGSDTPVEVQRLQRPVGAPMSKQTAATLSGSAR
jgi:DNA invertase Pin-like site-specific DNA recombinase